MDKSTRKIRGLTYTLTDVATALRASGRPAPADEIRILPRRIDKIPPVDFLEECRSALENVLIGQRDLPGDIIFALLDAMAVIDGLLREMGSA